MRLGVGYVMELSPLPTRPQPNKRVNPAETPTTPAAHFESRTLRRRGAAISCDLPLEPLTETAEYLGLLRAHLGAAVTRFAPDLIVYNAGTDCLVGDPLGRLAVSADGIVERDLHVFDVAVRTHTPVVMLLSGQWALSHPTPPPKHSEPEVSMEIGQSAAGPGRLSAPPDIF